jgi:hypothetical protein
VVLGYLSTGFVVALGGLAQPVRHACRPEAVFGFGWLALDVDYALPKTRRPHIAPFAGALNGKAILFARLSSPAGLARTASAAPAAHPLPTISRPKLHHRAAYSIRHANVISEVSLSKIYSLNGIKSSALNWRAVWLHS